MAGTRGLQDRFRPLADLLLRFLQEQDSRFRITSGFRTAEEQERLYAKWLAGDPSILTPAPPGRSQHQRGWAVDIARRGMDPKNDPALAALGAQWRELGGVWGGGADPVHFEAPKAWTGRRS